MASTGSLYRDPPCSNNSTDTFPAEAIRGDGHNSVSSKMRQATSMSTGPAGAGTSAATPMMIPDTGPLTSGHDGGGVIVGDGEGTGDGDGTGALPQLGSPPGSCDLVGHAFPLWVANETFAILSKSMLAKAIAITKVILLLTSTSLVRLV